MVLYQHHLPSEVRVFRYSSGPAHLDRHAAVFDGVAEPAVPTYCRSYMFFDRWLSVFITFDGNLQLKNGPHSAFPFALNCDITTPHHRRGDCLFTTDLCIDFLVSADGRSYQIVDRERLAETYRGRQFGKLWYEGAMGEVESLSALLKRGEFVDFVNAVHPFPTEPPEHPAATMECLHISDVKFEYHPAYPRFA